MNAAQEVAGKITAPGFDFEIGDLLFSPSYIQAVAIVFLLFLLVLTFARLRRLYVGWSLKGASSMIFLGFVLALILEGFLILGGRTMFTELLGWKDAPKPVSNALNAGRDRLVEVMGVTSEIPQSEASENATGEQVINAFQTLPAKEMEEVIKYICEPQSSQ